jgi:CheY-like chemotaxis protein
MRTQAKNVAKHRARRRALVVDDNHDNRALYGGYLRWRGWDVLTLSGGENAVAAATTFAPEVIIMDLAMPVVDGIEATRRLKRDRRTRDIPVVGLTAFCWKARDALDAGCAEFLTKPCTPNDLVAVIERVIEAG